MVGDIKLDIRPLSNVDVLCDAKHLPFKENTFTHVYASHVLEHFSWRVINNVIDEWSRVLKIGGLMELKMPNIKFIGFLISVLLERDYDYSWAMGGQHYERDSHKSLFPPNKLKKIMNRKNYSLIRYIPVKIEEIWNKPTNLPQKFRYRIMNALIHLHKNFSPEIHMIFRKNNSDTPTKEQTDQNLEETFYF